MGHERGSVQTMASRHYSREIADYRLSLYQKYLHRMTLHLNSVHGEKHSVRYWELIIGPWLLHFIYHAHHQYMRLDLSRQCVIASRRLFFIPYDFDTFNIALDTTDYAQQLDEMLSSDVAAGAGHWQPFYLHHLQLGAEALLSGPKRVLKRALKQVAFLLTPPLLRVAQAAMVSPSIRPPAAIKVWLASRLRVAPLFLPRLTPGDEKLVVRESLRTWRLADQTVGTREQPLDEFDDILHRLVLLQVPVVHLEDYKRHREKIRRLPTRRLKLLFSAMGWHEEEAFKLLAADLMERGVLLVGHQHGGLYGIADAELPEYEQGVVDQFWTWGWTDARLPSVRPFFSPKLSEVREKFDRARSRVQSRGDILFVSTVGSRHAVDGSGAPIGERFVTYFQQQISFLRELRPDVRKDVVVRRHSNERYGWKQEEQIRGAGIDVTFRRSEPPPTALAHARLVVVDANLTSILEAYVCDVPTVLFLDTKLWPLREKWADLFHAMEDAGLFHRSAESAAAFVNQVAADPAKWWNSDSVVPVRDQFRQTFARTSPSFARDLAQAILAASGDLCPSHHPTAFR